MLTVMKVAMASAAVLGLIACSSSSSAPKETGDSGGGTGPGSGTGTGPGGGGSMSVSDFCNALLSADAMLASQCFGGAASEYLSEENALQGSGGACGALEAAVTAGRITYDSDTAAACLSAYTSLSCADLAQGMLEPAACSSTIAGTVAKGGSCFGDDDCAGTASYCDITSATSCTGKCAPKIAAGGTCSNTGGGGECVTGYSCSSSGTGAAKCTKTAATKTAAKGASCAITAGNVVECAMGLLCNAKTQVCDAPVAEGDACTPGDDTCVAFTYCDATSKTCTADPTTGGKCGIPTGQMEYIDCLGGTYCKMTSGSESGVCAAPGGTGATCEGGQGCIGTCTMAAGATTGTCTAPCTAL